MKTAALTWLVALLFSIRASGAPQPNTESVDSGASIPATKEQKNANTLVRLLQHECLQDSKYHGMQSFHYYLATTVKAEALKSLYKMAIAQLIKTQPAEVVAAYVWSIHRRDGALTFALMAEMQLFLFGPNYKDTHSDAYLNDVAFYFYNIQNNMLYDNLELTMRRELEPAIQSLPADLRQFYFSAQFCMVNKHYNEYSYSSEFVEDGRRLIYTWLNPYIKPITPSTQYIWQKHVVDTLVDGAPLKGRANFVVSLNSKAYSNYIYMDRRKDNRIYGWSKGNEVAGSFWRVHFVSNALMFEQEGKFMCASSELGYEEKRRYIDGLTTATDNDSCHWFVQECPFQESILGTWFGSWFP